MWTRKERQHVCFVFSAKERFNLVSWRERKEEEICTLIGHLDEEITSERSCLTRCAVFAWILHAVGSSVGVLIVAESISSERSATLNAGIDSIGINSTCQRNEAMSRPDEESVCVPDSILLSMARAHCRKLSSTLALVAADVSRNSRSANDRFYDDRFDQRSSYRCPWRIAPLLQW